MSKQYMIARRWDYLLVQSLAIIKHYPLWKEFDDFENNLNIGVDNIHSENCTIETGYSKCEVSFCCGEFASTTFKFGEKIHSIISPDSVYNTTTIVLYIDDKRVICAIYSIDDSDENYSFADRFSLISVEEFHADERIGILLEGLVNAEYARRARHEESASIRKEAALAGKFTI